VIANNVDLIAAAIAVVSVLPAVVAVLRRRSLDARQPAAEEPERVDIAT